MITGSLVIYCIQERWSITGCRVDYIYGDKGIGSPHAHLVLFNQIEEYHRTLSGLSSDFLCKKIR